MLAGANLTLRLLLELAGIAAVAWWGYHALSHGALRIGLSIVAVVVLVVFWALLVAPKASNPIPPTPRFLIGSFVLLVAALALWFSDQPTLAGIFAVLIVLNTILMLVLAE
jgi:Na+/melibiose symporter-like transporter